MVTDHQKQSPTVRMLSHSTEDTEHTLHCLTLVGNWRHFKNPLHKYTEGTEGPWNKNDDVTSIIEDLLYVRAFLLTEIH